MARVSPGGLKVLDVLISMNLIRRRCTDGRKRCEIGFVRSVPGAQSELVRLGTLSRRVCKRICKRTNRPTRGSFPAREVSVSPPVFKARVGKCGRSPSLGAGLVRLGYAPLEHNTSTN